MPEHPIGFEGVPNLEVPHGFDDGARRDIARHGRRIGGRPNEWSFRREPAIPCQMQAQIPILRQLRQPPSLDCSVSSASPGERQCQESVTPVAGRSRGF